MSALYEVPHPKRVGYRICETILSRSIKIKYLIAVLFFLIVACPAPQKRIMFSINDKQTTEANYSFINNKLRIKIEGGYQPYLDPIDSDFVIGLTIDVEDYTDSNMIRLFIDSLSLSIFNSEMPVLNDYLDTLKKNNKKRKIRLSKVYISYPISYYDSMQNRNNEYPLKISFKGMIYLRNTPINIDTLIAEIPGLF